MNYRRAFALSIAYATVMVIAILTLGDMLSRHIAS